ncbi:MAG: nucleotidyl transferase AbiEii/AbiGii toxin family protein [Elusimicrobia bacterium]|nr:nucleotidyl transferase AbiEii/AbiGii toxin family protein [Elusimicrobiota bacterium]
MIDKKEIEIKSQELDIHTSNVQRDYVFGWLLSGIYHNENSLKNKLILKGGNCFRKAYFEHARFSNDLDFSTQVELDPTELHNEINKACEYAGDKTGILFALDKNIVVAKQGADEDNKFYEVRVYFKGFYGEESYFIKVKLDVKEFDKIFLPLQTRNIIHSYSDAAECKGEITCLKLEELLASKLKALLQRRHSPDLYDFIYSVFFQNILDINRLEVVKTFLKKTIYEPNPTVAKNLLLEIPFQTLKGFWHQYLVCPKRSLISFDEAESKFKLIIPELFLLLQPQPAYAFTGGGYRGGGYSLNYFPANYRNTIMEAGQLRKVLRMVYDGLERQVEPYSLTYKIRKDRVGREYFYGWDRTGGRSGNFTIKMYTADKVQSIDLTDETFEPRFTIELSRAGEFSGQTYFSRPFSDTPRIRAPKIRATSPRTRRVCSFSNFVYTIQCPVCLKKFKRSSYDTKLNKHKDSFGNRCYGSYGYIV